MLLVSTTTSTSVNNSFVLSFISGHILRVLYLGKLQVTGPENAEDGQRVLYLFTRTCVTISYFGITVISFKVLFLENTEDKKSEHHICTQYTLG